MNKFDLEERLICFSVLIIEITRVMSNCKAGNHLSGQLLRSGTSVSLNYGEAQSGESRRDFIHKIKVVLKELHETLISLKILTALESNPDKIEVQRLKKENGELVAIFISSVKTAKQNFLIKKD